MHTRDEVRNMIDNYKWMRNIIEAQVYDADSTSTAQYGIEAVMPKAKGGTGDKVLVKVLDRNREYRRNVKLLNKLQFIDKYEEYVTCLLYTSPSPRTHRTIRTMCALVISITLY